VCSMSDLFHRKIHFSDIATIFDIMARTPQHTYQVLTKQPENMLKFFNWYRVDYGATSYEWPFKNVWLGVTAENQQTADERIPLLLQIPAAVRFVSCEPLLKPVRLTGYLRCAVCGSKEWDFNQFQDGHLHQRGLDWVIVGGESGPGARPMHPDWARSLRDQCQAAGVPFFFKQWGAWYPNDARHPGFAEMYEDGGDARHCLVGDMAFARVGKKRAGRLLDGRTWDKYPISSEDRQ